MSTESNGTGRVRRGRKAPSVQHPSSGEHPMPKADETRNAECAGINLGGVAGPSGLAMPRQRGRFVKKFPVFPGISTYFRIIPDMRGKNAPGWAMMNREKGGRRKWRQQRGKMMESRRRNLLALTTLRIWSPAFCRKPPRKNVRLLFAFCSLKFLFYFLKLDRATAPGGHRRLMEDRGWRETED
jgi:hypothetical protein